MVKFKLLAQFLVDHLPPQWCIVLFSLIVSIIIYFLFLIFIFFISFLYFLEHPFQTVPQPRSLFPSCTAQQYIKRYWRQGSHLVQGSHSWETDSHQVLLTLWLYHSNLDLSMLYHQYWASFINIANYIIKYIYIYIIPLTVINWYDWKHLGTEPWATSLSIGPRYKEASKTAKEKKTKDH